MGHGTTTGSHGFSKGGPGGRDASECPAVFQGGHTKGATEIHTGDSRDTRTDYETWNGGREHRIRLGGVLDGLPQTTDV